jgi:hypothetical protein
MHKAIKKIEVKDDVLFVEASMQLRKYCKDPKDFLNTRMVIDMLSNDYNIIEPIKEAKISNWVKTGHTRTGTWEFKIEPKKKAPRRTSPKPAQEPEPEQVIEEPKVDEPKAKEAENPTPKPAPKRKPAARKQNTGTKRSIRGRMSKIAQDKLGE